MDDSRTDAASRDDPAGRHASGDLCEIRGADPARVQRARQVLLDDAIYARLAEIFRTLADASRARIVHSLLQQDVCTCDLAAITGLSEPAVSQHLRILRALRLVKSRREGKWVYYALDDEHVRFLLTISLQHLAHEANDATVPRLTNSGTTGRRAIASRTNVPSPVDHLELPDEGR